MDYIEHRGDIGNDLLGERRVRFTFVSSFIPLSGTHLRSLLSLIVLRCSSSNRPQTRTVQSNLPALWTFPTHRLAGAG